MSEALVCSQCGHSARRHDMTTFGDCAGCTCDGYVGVGAGRDRGRTGVTWVLSCPECAVKTVGLSRSVAWGRWVDHSANMNHGAEQLRAGPDEGRYEVVLLGRAAGL